MLANDVDHSSHREFETTHDVSGRRPFRRVPRRDRRGALTPFALVAAFLALVSLDTRACAQTYKLGADDKLRIYVHEWPALTGTFAIGVNGALSLPMIGELPAAGLETAELAAAISERLQKQAQLARLPNTSVEIVQYRPFYILGGVERPGEYPFRPGMTVLNALSIAGGVYRPREVSGWIYERESIQAAGDLQMLTLRRQELLAREARLKAEAEGLESVDFPSLSSQPDLESTFVVQERSLFQARLERYRSQLHTGQKTIDLYEKEIESLRRQISSEANQIKAVQRELDDTRAMVGRGLAPAPRVLPLERTIAQIEREQREHETSIIRARQQINDAEQKLAMLRDDRRAGAISDLKDVQSQLKEVAQRFETAQRLLVGAASSFPEMRNPASGERLAILSYSIVRAEDGQMRESEVTETTSVEPGDVVKVRLTQDNRPQSERQSRLPTESRRAETGVIDVPAQRSPEMKP